MRKQTKKFEKQFIKARNKIERKGIVLAKKMVREQYQFYLNRLKQVGLNQYQQIEIPESITLKYFKLFYPMSSTLAVMVYENLENQTGLKAETAKQGFLNSLFQRKLTEIVNTTAGNKITTITHTSVESIKNVIRGVLDEADTGGWGISELTSNIYREVGQHLRGNGYARAQAIAQTEMISASNQASNEAAEKITGAYGLNYKKFWSTSGLPGIRETHLEAERYSDEMDGLNPDETFPMEGGTAMLYPGDPNGDAKDVINCRCTIMQEIVLN